MTTTQTITPEEMTVYRATARRRWEQEQADLAARKERAWAVAHRAAAMLRGRFHATRVVVFGSLAHGQWFSASSDIDLAAWDIAPDDFFVAVAHCQDISPEFTIDLVDLAHCRPSLRTAIDAEGIEL